MKTRSCSYIESGLVLGNRRLQFCCVPHSDRTKGFVKICDYDGGPLPLATIARERARLIALNNTPGADSPCSGCWNLEEREWPRAEGAPTFAWIGIESYFRCNLRCAYCEIVIHEDWRQPASGYDLVPIFRELLAQGALAPGTRVVWGGGEPTILKGFEDIQRLLLEHDVFQQLHSNVIRYSETIAAGLARGKVELVCSVDSGTRAGYLRIKGGDHHETVWAHLARYARAGGPMTLKYIVRAGNTDRANLLGFVRNCVTAGVPAIALSVDMEEVAQGQLGPEHALAFALLEREGRRRGLRVSVVVEYLPDERARVLGLMGKRGLDARYAWLGLRRALGRARRELPRVLRRLRGRLGAPAALRRLRACAAPEGFEPAALLALCAREVRWPHAGLRRELVAGARRVPWPLAQTSGRATAIGVEPDGWTVAERAAFVALDNRDGTQPLVQVLWIACNAGPADLPLVLTLDDGRHDGVRYVYRQAERRRIELPPVPSGETALYAVRTDRSWAAPSGNDPRRLGVNLATEA